MNPYNPATFLMQLNDSYRKRIRVVTADTLGPHKTVATGAAQPGDLLLFERALAYESRMTLAGTDVELHPMYHLFNDAPTDETLESKLRALPGFDPAKWTISHRAGNDDPLEDIGLTYALPLVLKAAHLSYGRGLFNTACRINHSCAPNADYVMQGEYILVYALRPIASGEEVTIAYLADAPDLPREPRQYLIRKMVDFQCCCALCTGHETLLTKRDHALFACAQRWRKCTFDQVPELSGAAYEQGIHVRAPALRLAKVFLEQNMTNLINNPFQGTTRYVTKGLAALMTPLHPRVLLDDIEPWYELFQVARPLFLAHRDSSWYMGLAYCAKIVLGFKKNKGTEGTEALLLPESDSLIARLCGAQYVWYGCSASIKENYMIQLAVAADAMYAEKEGE